MYLGLLQAQPCPSHHGVLQAHLGQMLLRSKAKAINRVGATVCPLPELLGGFGKGHVGGDSAVDDGLGGGEHTKFKVDETDNNERETPQGIILY